MTPPTRWDNCLGKAEIPVDNSHCPNEPAWKNGAVRGGVMTPPYIL